MEGLRGHHSLHTSSVAASAASSSNRHRSSASVLRGEVHAASSARFLYPKLTSALPDKALQSKRSYREICLQSRLHLDALDWTMKKSDNTRSHSWWWDSHISPKNSKWLQENLSEMDAKVSAMLKIIEADADSFAQRAEMFYKKRPELINLVEEFYRTYRALVERYTYLTREIRQNIAPALQAQLGVSSESAQNSPVDLHSKRGIDGPDIISPSYSYTGDFDSPVSEVSAKGHTDDEFSPLGYRANYERRAFGYKPRYPNVEESSHKASESGCFHDTGDVSISQLQKEIVRLQDENKALNKSIEDATKLKSLELEVSSLQSKVRGLEAEDKQTKKRLKAVQEKEQKLEAENLKLSHSLMSSKEDKTEILEQHSKVLKEREAACQQSQSLEDQLVTMKQDLVTVKSQLLEKEEHLSKGEETIHFLQKAITTFEKERLKDSFLMEKFEQQSQTLQKRISDYEEKNAGFTEESMAQAAQIKELQDRLTNVMDGMEVLEERLHDSEKARSIASLKVEELQGELEGAQRDKQDLSVQMQQQAEDMARLNETIRKHEEECVRARDEKMEGAKYVRKLETDIEEGQKAAEVLSASCRQSEDRCRTLEWDIAQSTQKLLSSSEEIVQHQKQLRTFQNMVSSTELQKEELQKRVACLAVEKTSVMSDLEQVREHVKAAERQCAQMHEDVQDKHEQIERLKQELINQLADTKRLEESLSLVSKERTALVERGAENLLVHQQLENEHIQLKQQLKSIETEKTDLVHENQQMQQKLLDLHEENTVLSSHCSDSKAGLQAAETAARRAQEELALSVSEVARLREENHATTELNHKLMSDIESSETLLARCREENRMLGEDMEKCKKELADFEAQIIGLKASLSESVTVNATLAKQVAEKKKSIELLNHDLQGAQAKVLALNDDISLRANHAFGLQEEINTFKEEVKLLHTELRETSEAKQSLEAVVAGLQQKDIESKEANQTLVHEQQRLLNDLLLLQNKNQDFEASLSRLTEERAKLLEEAATHREQGNGMKERIMTLEADYVALQIQIGSLQGQLVKFEEEKQLMEEENKIFSKKLFEAEGRVQDLQLKVSNLLCEEAALAEQLSERICKIQSLEAALFDLQKDNAALSEDVGLLQQQLSALRTREASLIAEMHDSSDLIQFLKTEIERLQQEVLKTEEKEKHFALEQKRDLDECLLMRQKIENLRKVLGPLGEEKIVSERERSTLSGQENELNCEVSKSEAEKGTLQQELLVVQHMADQLQEELKVLLEERKQLSSILDFQKSKMEKQEENLLNLQQDLSCTKEEQQNIMDRMNLLTEEKVALQQELKESKHEAGRARVNFLKLEADFNQLDQMKGAADTQLGNKIKEVKSLQEDALILQTAKSEAEQHLELSLRQAIAQAEEARALQGMLAEAQQEKARLGSQLMDAKRRIMEINEECKRQNESCEALTQELAAVLAIKQKLEKELVEMQEEKTACTQKLEKMQQDMICLQEQKEQLMLNLEAVSLQGQEIETRFTNLQSQLDSAESSKLELAEKQSKMSLDWGASERMLLEEIANLKSASVLEKEELSLQHGHVIRLEDEIGNLQAERKALQSDKALDMNQIVNLQQHVDGLKNELVEKQEEALNLSVQVSALQKSLLSMEQESANVRELLQKDKECHDANEKTLKDELCLVQDEVVSKSKQISELLDALSLLQKKNGILVEGVSLKESVNVELQKEAQLSREVKEELTQKLQNRDAQLMQVQANLKILEAEQLELYERHCKLEDENKLAETCYQAQAQEHTLFKEQSKELTGALSNLQAENRMLKAQLADESSSASHKLLLMKEEKGEAIKKVSLIEAQVITLQQSLTQAKSECEVWKRQADNAADEVSCLKTEIQDLLSKISDLDRLGGQEHEKFEDPASNSNLLQQELAAVREENVRLSELVSDGSKSSKDLQEQVSSLNDSKQNLESALNLLHGQLKDSQMMLDDSERSQQASLHELQGHSQILYQMMSKIEDLEEILDLNPPNRLASIKHEAIVSQENSPQSLKTQGGNLQESISSIDSAKQLCLPEAIHDKFLSTTRRPFSFIQQPEGNCWQPKSPLFNVPVEIRSVNASDFETINGDQKSLFVAGVDAINRLKGKILTLLKADNSSEAKPVAALCEHESSVEEQEELSHFQQQIENLTFELSLYKKDISNLKKISESDELQEEGEVAHADVKAVLDAWKQSLMKSEEKTRGMQDQVEVLRMEKGSLQLMLSDLQVKALACASLLRENLLLSGKQIKLMAGEWDKRICGNGIHPGAECIDKLVKLENSCTCLHLDEEDNVAQSMGEKLLPGMVRTSPQLELSQSSAANAFVLKQLQKREEEVILLREAVEGMLPTAYRQDYGKEEKESELSSITGASQLNMPTKKHREEQQLWSFSTDCNETDSEHDLEEAGSIGDQLADTGDEIIETDSIQQAEEIIEGLARRLHINLGMRLHQALMDEKLENELQELQEERKKVEEGLRTRVEQVRRMEAELEKLQAILKDGSGESGMLDPGQQQQWLRRKKRAEKRARKLSKQLVLRRRQVGKMQDAVAAWIEQQELATKILEEQVLLLVDKEIAPTMEGWDVDQVNKLMEEMQSRKALTRRHSMDLHLVGQKLQKVGSSIESTQRQLLRREEQEVVKGRIGNESALVSVENHQKLSKFGLTWLLLLFSTERKGLFKRSRRSMPVLTPLESSKPTTSRRAGSRTAMRTLVARTRKLGCCACGSSSSEFKSANDN